MKEASGVRTPMASGWDSRVRAVANSGLRSAHHLFSRISGGGSCHELGIITQHAVAEFKTLLTLLDQSSPRRIRKGPLPNSPAAIDPAHLMGCNDLHGMYQKPQRDLFLKLDCGRDQRVTVPARRPILCSTSADGSSIATQLSSYYLTSNSVQGSMDESSVLSSKRKLGGEGSIRCTAFAGGCHCSNRRNIKIKRSMRVPAVSNKLADIPCDDFTWRKYGQKPIKGSPYPRNRSRVHFGGLTDVAADITCVKAGRFLVHLSWPLEMQIQITDYTRVTTCICDLFQLIKQSLVSNPPSVPTSSRILDTTD